MKKIIMKRAKRIFKKYYDHNNPDCGTDMTMKVLITEDDKNSYIGRHIKEDNKVVILNYDNIDDYINKQVEMYSIIFCRSLKFCKKCSGDISHLKK